MFCCNRFSFFMFVFMLTSCSENNSSNRINSSMKDRENHFPVELSDYPDMCDSFYSSNEHYHEALDKELNKKISVSVENESVSKLFQKLNGVTMFRFLSGGSSIDHTPGDFMYHEQSLKEIILDLQRRKIVGEYMIRDNMIIFQPRNKN